MNTKELVLTLLVSNRTGVTSSLMFIGRKLGLMYRKGQVEKIDDVQSRLLVTFTGDLNCSKADLIYEIESLPHIYSIENISDEYFAEGDSYTSDESAVENSSESNSSIDSNLANLLAYETITPESLKIAENALVDILGPVAPMVVESAASETKHIGDLFLKLAEELEGGERESFLSLVDGLK